MIYAVEYTKRGEKVVASFQDFPDITATGEPETIEATLYDQLIDKLMSYAEAGIAIPVPLAKPDPAGIELLPSIAAKVLLHNLAVSQNRSRSFIASQMGVTRQVMTRLFNLRETTKVETIQNALEGLNYRMVINIEPK